MNNITLADLINQLFWNLGIGYDPRKKIYLRDRKGRFSDGKIKRVTYLAAGGGTFQKVTY